MVRRSLLAVGMIGLLLLTFLSIPSAASLAAQEASTGEATTLSLDGPATASTGSYIEVAVTIDTTPAVYGIEFTVQSNTDGIAFIDATKGEFLSQNSSSIVVANDVSDSVVTYGETRIGTETGVTGSGTVATLNLSIADSISADSVTITFQDAMVADPNATALPIETSNLTIDIPDNDQSTAETTADGENGDTNTGAGTATDGDASGDESGSTSTATKTTSSAEWQSKIDASVMESLESSDRVPVLIELNSDSSVSSVAEQLNASGAANVTVHSELGVIEGQLSKAAVRKAAQLSEVQRIRQDPDAKLQETGSSGTGVTQTGTSDGAERSNQTAVSTTEETEQNRTRTAGTTQGSGPGFGPWVAIVALIVGVLRLYANG